MASCQAWHASDHVRLCTCAQHPGLPYWVVQVLLAIAAGAMLVTPEWLTASVEAGEWLPEEPFLAQVCCPSCAL